MIQKKTRISAGAGIKMSDFFYGEDDDGGNTLMFGKDSDIQNDEWSLLYGDKDDENSKNYEKDDVTRDIYETNDSHIFGDDSASASDCDW